MLFKTKEPSLIDIIKKSVVINSKKVKVKDKIKNNYVCQFKKLLSVH